MGGNGKKRKSGKVTRSTREDPVLQKLIDEARALSAAQRDDEAYRRMMTKFETYGHYPTWQERMGFICLNLHRTEEAEFYLLRALAKEPDASSLHSYLGYLYYETADYQKSIQHHKRALELNKSEWPFYVNFSHVAEKMGLYEQAMAALTVAHRLKKNEPKILFQLGELYLCFGRIEEGWQLYETGFGCGQRMPPIPRNQNYWNGEDASDKTILVWREQGIGDEIRNACLYHDLVAAAGKTIIECEPRLASIMERSFPEARIVPQADPPKDTAHPPFDYHIGQFSLHSLFRKSVEDYHRNARPEGFLTPDPEKVAFWRRRFESLGGDAIIGISWTSSLQYTQRKHHFFRPVEMEGILTQPGATFVNLFYGDAEEDLREAEERFGITIHRWADVDLKNDLETTFAMTAALDLLISAPTSSADIAAAVGTDTWSFAPKRSITRLGTDHLPHAPNVRVYDHQANEAWGPVLQRVGRDFSDWLESRRPPARKRA